MAWNLIPVEIPSSTDKNVFIKEHCQNGNILYHISFYITQFVVCLKTSNHGLFKFMIKTSIFERFWELTTAVGNASVVLNWFKLSAILEILCPVWTYDIILYWRRQGDVFVSFNSGVALFKFRLNCFDSADFCLIAITYFR